MSLCECGCKQECKNRFVSGHNNRGSHINLGRKATEKTKQKLRKVQSGEKNGFYGKHHTKEFKFKMSARMVGNKNRLGAIGWNKGLTKETDERIRKASEKISISNKGQIPWIKGKTKAQLPVSMFSEENNAKRMVHSGWRRFSYASTDEIIIKMRSSWEVKYANYLDSLNIVWQYEPKGFMLSNGKRYWPDFYLPNLNEYHEIKGWMSKESTDKIDLFQKDYPNEKLVILQEKELKIFEVI